MNDKHYKLLHIPTGTYVRYRAMYRILHIPTGLYVSGIQNIDNKSCLYYLNNEDTSKWSKYQIEDSFINCYKVKYIDITVNMREITEAWKSEFELIEITNE